MKASFKVNGKEFVVVFTVFGNEKYYYDGKLLLNRWSFRYKESVHVDCQGTDVVIAVNLSDKRCNVQAFIDGQLSVEELFPEIRKKINESYKSKGLTKIDWIKNIALWLVIFIAMFTLFKFIK